MKKPEAPCLDCDHRTMTCHDGCPGYEEYVKSKDEYNAIIRMRRDWSNTRATWTDSRKKQVRKK